MDLKGFKDKVSGLYNYLDKMSRAEAEMASLNFVVGLAAGLDLCEELSENGGVEGNNKIKFE